MESNKEIGTSTSGRRATRSRITHDDKHSYDTVICDFTSERTIYLKRFNDLAIMFEEEETQPLAIFSPDEIDQFNTLAAGDATTIIAGLIGIHRLRCGVRLYRMMERLYGIKKACRKEFYGRLISFARRRRDLAGRHHDAAGKNNETRAWLDFINRLRKEEGLPSNPIKKFEVDRLAMAVYQEELLQEAISLFNKQPDVLRKLQWSEAGTLFRKAFNYPLHFLILYTATHSTEKAHKRKPPPYALIGRFLEEQSIKTYTMEKGDFEQRTALASKDVRIYFARAQGIREMLNRFYLQCQDVYTAPLILPSLRARDANRPVIDAAIAADRQLRVFVDSLAVDDAPVFSQLFPPFEEILHINNPMV